MMILVTTLCVQPIPSAPSAFATIHGVNGASI
jgi:hypothetical protein